jgi:PTH1 family peptidyl-tRNA hydrolase
VDLLVQKNNGHFAPGRYDDIAELKWKGKFLFCIKPTTFMNLSGLAVKYWMDKEKIPMEHILVILDDIALPLPRIRLRPSGSAAGHNGLTSIEESLGSVNYPRLRFGVGNDFARGQQVEYVLGKWQAAELPLVNKKVEKSVEIIEHFAQIGIERTMNQYNKLVITL